MFRFAQNPLPNTLPHTHSVMYGTIMGTKHPLGGNCPIDGREARAMRGCCKQDSNPVLQVGCDLVLPAVSLRHRSGKAGSHDSKQHSLDFSRRQWHARQVDQRRL